MITASNRSAFVTLMALLAPLCLASMSHASEVDPLPQDQVQTRPAPRGPILRYEPRPRYEPGPPRGYLPPPAPRLGDLCLIEGRSGSRTCDLRRPAPLGSYCECVSPGGRVREGRVVR